MRFDILFELIPYKLAFKWEGTMESTSLSVLINHKKRGVIIQNITIGCLTGTCIPSNKGGLQKENSFLSYNKHLFSVLEDHSL